MKTKNIFAFSLLSFFLFSCDLKEEIQEIEVDEETLKLELFHKKLDSLVYINEKKIYLIEDSSIWTKVIINLENAKENKGWFEEIYKNENTDLWVKKIYVNRNSNFVLNSIDSINNYTKYLKDSDSKVYRITYYFNENGTIHNYQELLGYVKHGNYQSYYPSGKKKLHHKYVNGSKEGKLIEYYEVGTLKYSFDYKNNLRHGWSVERRVDGMILDSSYYEEGVKVKTAFSASNN